MSAQRIENLIAQLSLRDKMRLVQKLERQTLRERWKGILRNIDQRLRRFPISSEEITREIQTYRKEKHAQNRR